MVYWFHFNNSVLKFDMVKLLLFASLLSYSTDSLPPLDDLYQSIDQYYQVQTAADLLEFADDQRGSWIKYLPSVGVNYALVQTDAGNLATRPRPTVTYNTSKLQSAHRDKQRREKKRRSIAARSQLLAARDRQKVYVFYRKYYLAFENIQIEYEIAEIERQLFEIKEAKYKRGEILPDEYLIAKKAYLSFQQSIIQQRNALESLRLDVIELSKIEAL